MRTRKLVFWILAFIGCSCTPQHTESLITEYAEAARVTDQLRVTRQGRFVLPAGARIQVAIAKDELRARDKRTEDVPWRLAQLVVAGFTSRFRCEQGQLAQPLDQALGTAYAAGFEYLLYPTLQTRLEDPDLFGQGQLRINLHLYDVARLNSEPIDVVQVLARAAWPGTAVNEESLRDAFTQVAAELSAAPAASVGSNLWR